MHFNNFLFIAVLFLILSSCSNKELQSNAEKRTVEIPKLLDRTEDLWLGVEWDQVQSTYVKNREQLKANAQDSEAALQLASLFMNEARVTGEHGHYYPAALQVLNLVLDTESISKDVTFRALSHKANVLLSLHQFDKALSVAKKAVAINPYNAPIYGILTDAYVELGQYEEAVKMTDKMISIRPDLRSYSRVSYLREIHGDIDGAIQAMQLAIQAGFPGNEQTAWTRLTLGELYALYGKEEAAKQQFLSALQERPNYPFAIAALAQLDLNAKNYKAAEEKLQKAIAIIPEIGFYEQLAQLYKETNQIEQYKEIVEAMFPMLEDDVANGHQMNMEYAALYLELFEEPEKALEYALIEYNSRPQNIDVNRLLAKIYAAQGAVAKVKAHFATASSTNSKHPDLKKLEAQLAMN